MKLKSTALALALLASANFANAADYKIDSKNAHASINLKVNHLGYSWLTARFNEFDGQFSLDEKNIEASKISLTINTASFDSNLALRDKHVKSEDFLDIDKFPQAKFESTKVKALVDGKLEVTGNLTLRDVTKSITIAAEKVGEGKDPWGGYRAGFTGTTQIEMKDFGVPKDLGSASSTVYFTLNIEGIKVN